MRPRDRAQILVALFIALACSACQPYEASPRSSESPGEAPPLPGPAAEEGSVAAQDGMAERLRSARALWRERGEPSYSFEIRRSNPLMVQPRVRLTVLDGRPSTVVLVPFEEPLPPGISVQPSLSPRDSMPESWPTVDGLFAIVESAASEAVRVEADFDPHYGYPIRIFVDPTHAFDDEYSIAARALDPIR